MVFWWLWLLGLNVMFLKPDQTGRFNRMDELVSVHNTNFRII